MKDHADSLLKHKGYIPFNVYEKDLTSQQKLNDF